MPEAEIVAPVPTQNTTEPAVTEIAEPTTTEAVAPASDKPEKTEGQKQFEAAQRAAKKAERNNARLFRENEEFRAQLAELKQRVPQQETPKVQVDPNEVQRLIKTEAQELARIERLNDRCNAIANKGKTEFPDWDDALRTVSAELPLFTKTGATPFMEALMEMDNPAALLHHLGKDADLAAELSELSPIQLTRRLDRIERDMKPAKQPASTPKPLETVKTTSSPDEPDPEVDPKAWIAMRNKREAEKRRH